jgi:prophage regulatory protein
MARILRKRQVTQKISVSSAQLDRLEKTKRFPQRVQLGERMVGWLEDEVDQWIADRAAEREE